MKPQILYFSSDINQRFALSLLNQVNVSVGIRFEIKNAILVSLFKKSIYTLVAHHHLVCNRLTKACF